MPATVGEKGVDESKEKNLKKFKKGIDFLKSLCYYNRVSNDTEKSRSWSSAHDWKSCNL